MISQVDEYFREIMKDKMDGLTEVITNTILEEVIQLTLEMVYKEMNEGKNIFDARKIYEDMVVQMRTRGKNE